MGIVYSIKQWWKGFLQTARECYAESNGQQTETADTNPATKTQGTKEQTETGNTYYMVLSQDRYYVDEKSMGTYGGYLFETRKEAEKHAKYVTTHNNTYIAVAVAEVKTKVKGMTVAKYNYAESEDYKTTVRFQNAGLNPADTDGTAGNGSDSDGENKDHATKTRGTKKKPAKKGNATKTHGTKRKNKEE